MKIDLSRLSEGIEAVITASEDVEGLEATGVKVLLPLTVEVTALKIQGTLDIKGKVSAKVLLQCARCLEEREDLLEKPFRFDYPFLKQDKFIDITNDIRQEVILSYPLKPLCGDGCKGLCLRCGENLNLGECLCD